MLIIYLLNILIITTNAKLNNQRGVSVFLDVAYLFDTTFMFKLKFLYKVENNETMLANKFK